MKFCNRNFSIGNIEIGLDHPAVVIAEIGINHNGSLSIAKEMVDSAERAGVKIIKHQTHIPSEEMSRSAKLVKPGNSDDNIFNIIENCSLSEEDEYELMKYIEEKGLIFLSTPFSLAAVDRLKKFNVQAYKIGSGECNNLPLIEKVCEIGKPVILSTGMNNIQSIKESIKIFKKYKIKYSLLHTTNLYPTPYHLVRLGAMQEMMNEFSGTPIGLSDHTTNSISSLGAIALGAKIIERHYTDNKSRVGPDICCSMDEFECRTLIENIKILEAELGGKKEATKEESVTIKFAFATVVSKRKIYKGEVLNEGMITVKRPGIGEIPARDLKKLLGKIATKDIEEDEHIKYEYIS